MSIKAVLFDMDGVLLDAKEWHYEALNKALELEGFTPISRQDHLTIYDGLPTAVKLRRHLPNISEDKRKEINDALKALNITMFHGNFYVKKIGQGKNKFSTVFTCLKS